ncbi:glycosyltransferase family 39 protein [Gloeocapsa sp. PCC 73106]|uniref:ArnT family glycosyltransferase n=1 Tax=Gloeocapsa sp. PCC 73106 TaxID=102232 RepID=UPI0002AC17F6|nr:glycosyltransferase family 39 protein [Gloeocapsa sp. PCC 73106]ELR97606.1 hypothetical protein GLO73106DRAFT_00014180 [Gloeocapsa sp. PCC 73106]
MLRTIPKNVIYYIIFLLSFLLRSLQITIPLNVDEVSWLHRSTLFFKFLFQGNLAETFLRHHPGVTNMWLYGSGMLLNCKFNQLFPELLDMKQSEDILSCLNTIASQNIPISLYVIPRLLQAVVTSACMVIIYVLAKRLLGQAVALAGIILLILEPFFLAYQRFLTTDALQANFSAIGMLLFLLYLRRKIDPPGIRYAARFYLISSGVFMGLAVAAKIPTLFILPGVFIWIVLIELGLWRPHFHPRGWRVQMIDMCLWLMTIFLVFYLILPAMWVAPLETLSQLRAGLSEENDYITHRFFLGEIRDTKKVIFHLFYPLALIYRLSPVVHIGLLVCILILLIPKLRRNLQNSSELLALILVSLSVMFFLSRTNQKYDRYLLLIYPQLILLAGSGWISIFVLAKRRFWMAILMVGLQILVLAPHYPYYITYFNPLFGGGKTAQNLIHIGQGEGLEQIASFLNQSPDANSFVVASYMPNVLDSYFQGMVLNLAKIAYSDPNLLIQTNYVVSYISQRQRESTINPELLSFFNLQQPLYKATLHNVDYARVYSGLIPLPENLKYIQTPLSLSFGEQVTLLGYDLITSQVKPGEELVIASYWKFWQTLPTTARIGMTLYDINGKIKQTSQSSLINNYISLDQISLGTIIRDVHKLKTDYDLPLGRYQIALEWWIPEQDQKLEVTDSQGKLPGNKAVIGNIEVVK